MGDITIFTGAIYRSSSNEILFGYQQYLCSGYRGRFGAERLRRIVAHKTGNSTALHTNLNVKDLRQALVAFLDYHVGHAQAENIQKADLAHDMQSGHSSIMATTHYAIGSEDLPNTNRYDVHFFMKVSENWFRLLGEQLPLDGFTELGQGASPSIGGQSLEDSTPAIMMSSKDGSQVTTVIKEVTEIYPDIFHARLLPVVAETFALLKDLRGEGATFRNRDQAAAVQTIISNPGINPVSSSHKRRIREHAHNRHGVIRKLYGAFAAPSNLQQRCVPQVCSNEASMALPL